MASPSASRLNQEDEHILFISFYSFFSLNVGLLWNCVPETEIGSATAKNFFPLLDP